MEMIICYEILVALSCDSLGSERKREQQESPGLSCPSYLLFSCLAGIQGVCCILTFLWKKSSEYEVR